MTEEKTVVKSETEKIHLVADDAGGPLRVGAIIDEFVIQRLLGRGGLSEVYAAEDTRTNTIVALKFLLPERLPDEQSRTRLRNEARQIRTLRHKNIVSVVDIRENETTGPFIIMELIHGKPLTEQLPLPEKQALEVCVQLAEALGYAHSKGMIHRDIKPSNVMILEDGSIRLLDFGIAKVLSDENPKHIPLTRTNEVVGTSLYMSPEQCFGQNIDARTDIYQLGCLLFQCIAGFPPFQGSTSFEAMYKHVSAQPDLSTMSGPVRSILTKALDKNPEERFQSSSDMALALREAIHGRSAVRHKRRPPLHKNALLAIAIIALSAGALVWYGMTKHGSVPLTANQLLAQRYFEEGLDYKAKGWTELSRQSLTKAINLDKGAIGFRALSFLRSHLPAHFQTEQAEQLNIEGYNLNYTGQTVQAERVWLDCINRYPNFEWPYSNLALLYLDEGKVSEAVRLLEKAIEINPYYTNALRNMSDAQLKLGNRDAAIKYMERAAESAPEDPTYQRAVQQLRMTPK